MIKPMPAPNLYNCCNIVCNKKGDCKRFTYSSNEDRTYFNPEHKENCDSFEQKHKGW